MVQVKPHLLLTLRPGVRHRDVGPWQGVALTGVEDRGLRADVDRVLRRHRRSVWPTHEYERASSEWTRDERALGLDRTFRLVSQTDRAFPRSLVADLASLASVESARGLAVATTPMAAPVGGGRTSSWAGDLIGLDDAHRTTAGRPDVRIAVLDTGVNPHPELTLSPGRDFVDLIPGADTFVGDSVGADDVAEDPGVGHGMHVSGIIAAKGTAMPPGVAPRCRIVPVRVLGALERDGRLIGAGVVDNIDQGIKWAVDAGATVINMSLGIKRTGGGLPHARVIAYARRRGVVVVAASGNDGTDALYYPGSLPGVLAVGAVGRTAEVTHFSTWGRQVALVSPGEEIYSCQPGGAYGFASGTSQASPFVAGAAALVVSHARDRGTDLSAAHVARILTSTCNRRGTAWRDQHYGAGVLDVRDALRLLDLELDHAPDTYVA